MIIFVRFSDATLSSPPADCGISCTTALSTANDKQILQFTIVHIDHSYTIHISEETTSGNLVEIKCSIDEQCYSTKKSASVTFTPVTSGPSTAKLLIRAIDRTHAPQSIRHHVSILIAFSIISTAVLLTVLFATTFTVIWRRKHRAERLRAATIQLCMIYASPNRFSTRTNGN
ncbi:hypothetical protein Tcan_15530 [Toxocara canis]|uniref:Uncharacterized protein n=1 Tax=Toxocara canis TaxID=6265 RepID=A0A0B2W0G4_TOXCA|nr:hypothetical protein Tcan_15530 [Toxocara canis]